MIPAAYALYVRWQMPESVRYLEAKGRHEEAETTVRRFEEDVDPEELRLIDAELARAEARVEAVDQDLAEETSIWSPKLRGRTLAFWIVWFCVSLSYYGAFTWIPSLLVADGFTMVRSFSFTLIITLAQLPGYAVAAWLIEKWGRRMTLAVFLAGSAVSAGLYGLAAVEWQILAAGMLLSFFALGAWGALYAIGPELYPTHIRATGTGAAAGFGRIASIIAPLIVPLVMSNFGMPWLFALFAVSYAVAAIAAFTLPEQKGRRLDA